MFSILEQFPNVSKPYIEAQLAVIDVLVSKAVEGFAKATELNMSGFNESLAESNAITAYFGDRDRSFRLIVTGAQRAVLRR